MTVKELFDKMSECNLFMGIYDGEHGSEEFMHGVGTVMEYIAYHVSEETLENFSEKFTKNLVKSLDKIENQ